ncbi:MAG: hypothetical protein ACK4IK_09230 [Bacteroidia bacterium]
MKKILFISLLILSCNIYAQRRIALQHNGNTSIYGGTNPLTDAYNDAQNGDTIYVTGGLFSIPTIQKKICLIGTGYFNDSLTATGRSQINGINIGPGASGTVITGVYISGNLYVDGHAKIDSLFIFRNQITGDFGYPGGNVDKADSLKSKDVVFAENRVNSIGCENVNNIKVFNNIAKGIIGAKNGWIRNNVLLGVWYGCIHSSCKESLFENNFLITGWYYAIYNNTFINNVFSNDPTTDLNNTFVSNYPNQNINTVFVNYIDANPHNYLNNFHLQNPSSYPANNATEIGIYGGFYPFKEGSLPTNPHISSKNIATQTNSNGDLSIQIEVSAQNN